VAKGSEVAFQMKVLLKGLIAIELSTVVKSGRLKVSSVLFDSRQGRLSNGSSGSRVQLIDDSKAGLTFHECEKAVVTISANDSVRFPMT
jgi:hypothetical protein